MKKKYFLVFIKLYSSNYYCKYDYYYYYYYGINRSRSIISQSNTIMTTHMEYHCVRIPIVTESPFVIVDTNKQNKTKQREREEKIEALFTSPNLAFARGRGGL